jgi:hypothetical protein
MQVIVGYDYSSECDMVIPDHILRINGVMMAIVGKNTCV